MYARTDLLTFSTPFLVKILDWVIIYFKSLSGRERFVNFVPSQKHHMLVYKTNHLFNRISSALTP